LSGECECQWWYAQIIPRKKNIRDVRDDFIAIITKDFKNTVKRSFAEGEGGNSTYFRLVDPVMFSLYVEVIREFVADEGSK